MAGFSEVPFNLHEGEIILPGDQWKKLAESLRPPHAAVATTPFPMLFRLSKKETDEAIAIVGPHCRISLAAIAAGSTENTAEER